MKGQKNNNSRRMDLLIFIDRYDMNYPPKKEKLIILSINKYRLRKIDLSFFFRKPINYGPVSNTDLKRFATPLCSGPITI